MRRLTARILLIFALLGTFVPLALAISTPAPHTCCMRKPMADRSAPDPQIHAFPACCNHDCCRVVVTSQWAQITAVTHSQRSLALFALPHPFVVSSGKSGISTLHSGRSPPHFSIA